MTGRERILTAIAHGDADHLALMPITMMLAADTVGVKYGEYARDHRVLAEAQIRTAEKYGFDFVSTISDPGREAADFGSQIEWFDDQPPALLEDQALLADKSILTQLKPPDPFGGGRMQDRIEGVELLRRRVGAELFVEGWVEGPCAEGSDLRGINRLMTDFFDDPDFVRDLFEMIVDNALRFATAQIQAGADIIGIGDAAASLVGPKVYSEFVWPFEKKLVDGIHAAGGRARLHICGNTRRILEPMGRLGCEIVDLDFLAPLGEARAQMVAGQVLLGNIDPVKVLLKGTPESITAALAECHKQAGRDYIVSAGCEVVRDTPEANMRALCEYALQHRP